ncbi:Uncharacterized protein dnm_086840 [Desulfonema magnum]|uniref:Uncharacterized protein n=1 Tax=Desulfonema magnum TaxID=45655 RepID=A0A975BVP3_9BACT|nr:Uncharacterized protein dnm_086840 [Desulfonema magnum]
MKIYFEKPGFCLLTFSWPGAKRVCPTFYTRTGFMCKRRGHIRFFRHKGTKARSLTKSVCGFFVADFLG